MSCGSWLARSLVSRGLGCPSVLNRHRTIGAQLLTLPSEMEQLPQQTEFN